MIAIQNYHRIIFRMLKRRNPSEMNKLKSILNITRFDCHAHNARYNHLSEQLFTHNILRFFLGEKTSSSVFNLGLFITNRIRLMFKRRSLQHYDIVYDEFHVYLMITKRLCFKYHVVILNTNNDFAHRPHGDVIINAASAHT